MDRKHRAALAAGTLEILTRGRYSLPEGPSVDIGPAVERCLNGTRLFVPQELPSLIARQAAEPAIETMTISVVNQTTLAATFALARDGRVPGVLNFASARNPGGGFLNGSQAQEESLARSSALHASQQRVFSFYERHRAEPSCLYSDAIILSPECPLFRRDDGTLLPQPVTAHLLTCAAPNAGAVARREADQIPVVLRRRVEAVFAVAANAGCKDLVLGAWGCGVFRNDPRMVARSFADHLRGGWRNRFRRIVFAVLDTSPERLIFRSFADEFAGESSS